MNSTSSSGNSERPTVSKRASKKNNSDSKASKNKVVTRASRKVCQERLACKGNKPEAHYKCEECSTFQCEVCEELLHENSRFIYHERHHLEEISGELLCQGDCEDRNFSDVECSECARKFCFACDLASHSQGARKKHSRRPVVVIENSPTPVTADSVVEEPSDQEPATGDFKSFEPDQEAEAIGSALPLDEVNLEDSLLYPGETAGHRRQDEHTGPTKQHHHRHSNVQITNGLKMSHNNTTHSGPRQQLPDIAQMPHEPYDNSDLLGDVLDEISSPSNMRGSNENGNGPFESFLLVDEFESMQIASSEEFAAKLGCGLNTSVKVVSIFGNTGEGKSHTLNYTFFEGNEIFKTSPAQSSCTIGIWAAYDTQRKVITIDTEGLLGISENNNRRTRLLLKVLAVSDVIIYRTRAERLHNDLFSFLGDASRAYLHHFSTELKAAAQRCSFSGPISDLGPVVVVFHETLHTDVLRTEDERSPEDVLRRRFQTMGLPTEAYSAFEYVGTRTTKAPTSFKGLRDAMRRHLQNSTVRSARTPAVIFSALNVLNDKFSGDIERTVISTFPDEYFTCSAQCLSCDCRCVNSMNHHRDGLPHKSRAKCIYQHQFENKRFFCRSCYDRGEEIQVIPKTSASHESTWFGLANYAISGYVLECSRCGVIYRSRQYWYGNQEPWDCVHTEVRHIWEGEPSPCQGTQNAAQRMLDSMSYLSETVTNMSAKPASAVKSWVADQIAPPYWVPNHKITCCGMCERTFEEAEKKHHCRSCGNGFCDECSNNRCPVPDRGWGDEPVRVCDRCHDKIQVAEALRAAGEPAEVIARKVGEKLQATVGTVVSAIDYPISCIKDYARPEYWKPDHEIKNCCVCEIEFSEKIPIHHCRACGGGVCQPCSQSKKPVKSRGWDMPVRVCNACDKKTSL